jgi:hypothetical protein
LKNRYVKQACLGTGISGRGEGHKERMKVGKTNVFLYPCMKMKPVDIILRPREWE